MIGKLQTKLFSKTPSFWTLQLLGWSAYGMFMVLTFFPMISTHPGSLTNLVVGKSIRAFIGFGLSSTMRLTYRRLWRASPHFSTVSVVALLFSPVFGFAWMVLDVCLKYSINPAFDVESAISKATKETFDYSYVLLSWSAIYPKPVQCSDQTRHRFACRSDGLVGGEARSAE